MFSLVKNSMYRELTEPLLIPRLEKVGSRLELFTKHPYVANKCELYAVDKTHVSNQTFRNNTVY